MLYKKHVYPYGFLAIELAVKLQELLEPGHPDVQPYQYSSEALEVVDEIVRKKLKTPEGIESHLAKILSAMFDCEYEPGKFAEIADLMSNRIESIKAAAV
jgi:hypothetical protein